MRRRRRSRRASPARATSTSATAASPSASINFVTAHDGFTLADLVSYNEKHNEANGEDNRDGTDDNRSWNCGVEGPTDDPEIIALRERQQRNFLATLLLSQGVPMLLGRRRDGPHAARQQQRLLPGQRDLVARLGARPAREQLLTFTRRLIALRRTHPIFHRTQFLSGTGTPSGGGLPDAWWFRPDGRRMNAADWQNGASHALGVFFNGRSIGSVDEQGEPVVDASFVLLLNAHHEDITFTLPPRRFGPRWQVELSTAHPDAPPVVLTARGGAHVSARSLLLLRQPGPA